MRTYRQLFSATEFCVLFLAQCLTIGSASIGSLALGTITFAESNSPVLTGLAVFGGPIVRLFASWFLGSLADLLPPRRALVIVAAIGAGADAIQILPDLPWGARFGLLALPWVAMAATGGSLAALASDILPAEAFVLGRATLNLAVGVTQIAAYALGGILLITFHATQLFILSAASGVVTIFLVRLGLRNHAPRSRERGLVSRSMRVNVELLASPILRPLLLTLWVPNGLIVGCESLFIPYAGKASGTLFALSAAGMLLGDVIVGRYLPTRLRARAVNPLRILLAAPYIVFLTQPSFAAALISVFIASVGYASGLPLQERLIQKTPLEARGQVLGLHGTGLLGMQGIGALLAGAVAQSLGSSPSAAATAMGLLAIASLVTTAVFSPGLARSAPNGHRLSTTQ